MTDIVDSKVIQTELEKVGIHIDSIYDLVNTSESYTEAIPILIDLVQKEFPNKRIQEGIVRALTIKEAKGKANKALLSVYKNLPDKCPPSPAWAIGNAFTVIITKDDIDSIIPIVLDRSNGTSRQMFVEALGKIKSSELVEDTLMKLLDDDDVMVHAIHALGRLRSQKAKDKIIPLLEHPRSLVRRETKNALKKIG